MNEFFSAALFTFALLLLLGYLNERRDRFFKAMAQRFGLRFERVPMPEQLKKGERYPIRRLEGMLRGNRVLIEDTLVPYISSMPALSFLSNASIEKSPQPLFGATGLGGFRVHTDYFINGERKNFYLSEANFVAPLRIINATLQNLAAYEVPRTKSM